MIQARILMTMPTVLKHGKEGTGEETETRIIAQRPESHDRKEIHPDFPDTLCLLYSPSIKLIRSLKGLFPVL